MILTVVIHKKIDMQFKYVVYFQNIFFHRKHQHRINIQLMYICSQ